MDRCLKPELLDDLAPDDPAAIQSRRDLQRLNLVMGHVRMLARALAELDARQSPRRIVELGAGDGTLLLKVAQRLPAGWSHSKILLVDRSEAVSFETKQRFKNGGFSVETCVADVFDWIRQHGISDGDLVVANLFLHHFPDQNIGELFGAISKRAQGFVALEPKRALWPLAFSHMLWFIGCNRVTRHDAPISVRAGFNRAELSRLWPAASEWSLVERSAGLFSHAFVASKTQ